MLESSTVNRIEARNNMIQPEDKIEAEGNTSSRFSEKKLIRILSDEERIKVSKLIESINTSSKKVRGKLHGELVGIIKPSVEKAAESIAHAVTDGKIDSDLISEAVTNALYESILKREKGQKLNIDSLEPSIMHHLKITLEAAGDLQRQSHDAEWEFARQQMQLRPSPLDLDNPGRNPEKDLETKQVKEALNGFLKSLPNNRSMVLKARYLKGKTQEEIAAEMECSPSYVDQLERQGLCKFVDFEKKSKQPSRKEWGKAIEKLRSACLGEGQIQK